MSDYNIKIGVDSRSASRGVKSFTSDLNASLKALRDFDKKANATFAALDQFSKINGSNATRAAKSVAQAVNELNKIKVSRALVGNLQSLQKALSGIKFSGASSLKKLPDALRGLESIRINPALIGTLTQMKAALKGFSGPPKSLANWAGAFAGLDKIKINATLANRVEALKNAVRGFVGPAKSAWNLPNLLRQLARNKLPPSLAANIAALKTALAGFHGPSARAGTNLASLITAIRGANPSQIAAIAAALQRLNGLNINIGRTLASMGASGGRSMATYQRGIMGASASMRQFMQQTHMASRATHMLSAALGGVTLTSIIKGIYDTGSSYLALQRTLGAVATSSSEVESHLQFISDLTEKMPVSLEAAHKAYSKFAVAARLSGMSAKDTQEIFENFSVGFSAMGLSGESQKYAFLALEQMISKGTIQMEELRRQLGDHLPGAVQLLADSLGVPTSELIKMVEQGKVTADALIGMGKRVKEQFEAASRASMNSSQGQIIAVENAWVRFKRIVFGSDFNAALGALAKRLAEIMESKDMQQFASDVGKAFGRAFKAVAGFATLLAENKDTVISFLKGFALYSLVVAAASALRLFAMPLALLGPVLGIAAGGFGALSKAMKLLFTGQIVASAAKFFTGMTLKLLLFAGVVVGLAAAFDYLLTKFDAIAGTSLGGNFDSLISGITSAGKAMMNEISKMDPFASLDSSLDGVMGSFDADMEKIAKQNLIFEETMKKNAVREETQAAIKAKTLSDEAEKLWDKLDPIRAANVEYQEQLALITEIAKKKGLPDGGASLKKVLDAQTLEDRDPLGATVAEYRKELALLKAKTGEQKALNAAKLVEEDLLKKGIILTQQQIAAIAEYHKGIAMMNGELGNGMERWAATVGDFNDNMQEAIKDGIGGLSDEITNFVTGAEADFAGLARSILRTFVKISLDSLLKDLFGAMGQDGEKNGASMAEQALSKIAGLGETITTANTNVFTSGLSINGLPIGANGLPTGAGPMASSPELPSARAAAEAAAKATDRITRAPLAPIPGTDVAAPFASSNDRFAMEPINNAAKNIEDTTLTLRDRMLNGSLKAEDVTADMGRAAVENMNASTAATASSLDGLRGSIDTATTGLRGSIDATAATTSNLDSSLKTLAETTVPAKGPGLAALAPNGLIGQGGGSYKETGMMVARGADKVDARLRDIMETAAKNSGLEVSAYSGWRPYTGKPGGTGLHTKGLATDVQLRDPNTGKIFGTGSGGGHYQTAEHFRQNELFAQEAKRVQMEKYPELNDKFRWGGYFSSRKGPKGYGALDGMHYDLGGKNMAGGSWRGGLTDEMRQAYPGIVSKGFDPNAPRQGGVAGSNIDPMTTQGIDTMKAKLTEIGTAAQTSATGVDTMKMKLSETGTVATTAGQQTATANQMKGMSEQTTAMQTQMAGTQIMSAGTNAATAGPQFTQAGTAIASAGQTAAMAGQQAQAGAGGVGGFGQGISALLGPLAQAIPGLGQFGGMIMQLLSSLFSGGGMMGGLFAEGGISGSAVKNASLPAAAWAGAPHYAEGIANTSGGLPAVLHPNEAVIPLTRGREVPVDLGDREPRQEKLDSRQRPTINFTLNGVKDADTFKRSRRQIAADLDTAQRRSSMRNN